MMAEPLSETDVVALARLFAVGRFHRHVGDGMGFVVAAVDGVVLGTVYPAMLFTRAAHGCVNASNDGIAGSSCWARGWSEADECQGRR